MFEQLSKMLKIFKFQANAVLKDGTEIIIDGNLDVGVNVYVVTADGDQPLPDGEYELGEPYEGSIIVVEGGVITNVLEPVVEEEPTGEPSEEVEGEEEEETEPETEEGISLEEQLSIIAEQVKDILERLEKIEMANADLSKDNEELKKEKEEFVKQINEFKEKLEKASGAEPIKKKTENLEKSIFSKSSRIQALKNYKG